YAGLRALRNVATSFRNPSNTLVLPSSIEDIVAYAVLLFALWQPDTRARRADLTTSQVKTCAKDRPIADTGSSPVHPTHCRCIGEARTLSRVGIFCSLPAKSLSATA